MNIVKNDSYVRSINCAQMALIKRVYDQYHGLGDITLFETIHGFVAQFDTVGSVWWQEEGRLRLGRDDLEFWTKLGDSVRWFEVSNQQVEIGF